MKKIIALILILTCLFSLSSCAVVPAYNYVDLVIILEKQGYETSYEGHSEYEGIDGYLYAYNSETGDELYYVYCNSFSMSNTIYEYIKSSREMDISSLKMEFIQNVYAILFGYTTAAEKGDDFENIVHIVWNYVEIQEYGYGHVANVVWFGTKQAIKDIRFAK